MSGTHPFAGQKRDRRARYAGNTSSSPSSSSSGTLLSGPPSSAAAAASARLETSASAGASHAGDRGRDRRTAGASSSSIDSLVSALAQLLPSSPASSSAASLERQQRQRQPQQEQQQQYRQQGHQQSSSSTALGGWSAAWSLERDDHDTDDVLGNRHYYSHRGSDRPRSQSPPVVPEPTLKRARHPTLAAPFAEHGISVDNVVEGDSLLPSGQPKVPEAAASRSRRRYADRTGLLQDAQLPAAVRPYVQRVTSYEFDSGRTGDLVYSAADTPSQTAESSRSPSLPRVVRTPARAERSDRSNESDVDNALLHSDLFIEECTSMLLDGRWTSRFVLHVDAVQAATRAQSIDVLAEALLSAFGECLGSADRALPGVRSLKQRSADLCDRLRICRIGENQIEQLRSSWSESLGVAELWLQRQFSESNHTSSDRTGRDLLLVLLRNAQSHVSADASTRGNRSALAAASVAAYALAAAADHCLDETARSGFHTADVLLVAASDVLAFLRDGLQPCITTMRKAVFSALREQTGVRTAGIRPLNHANERPVLPDEPSDHVDRHSSVPHHRSGYSVRESPARSYDHIVRLLSACIFSRAGMCSTQQTAFREAALFDVLLAAALANRPSGARITGPTEAQLRALMLANFHRGVHTSATEVDVYVMEHTLVQAYCDIFRQTVHVYDTQTASRRTYLATAPVSSGDWRAFFPCAELHLIRLADRRWSCDMQASLPSPPTASRTTYPLPRAGSLFALCLDAIEQQGLAAIDQSRRYWPALPTELLLPVLERLGNKISPSIVSKLVLQNAFASVLDLSFSRCVVTDSFCSSLLQLVQSTGSVIDCSLQLCSLEGCAQISDAGIAALCEVGRPSIFASLAVVKLGGTSITDVALSIIAKASQHSIYHVDLACCRTISDTGVCLVIEFLPVLSELVLRGCTTLSARIIDALARRILRDVRPLPFFSMLDFRNCPGIPGVELFSFLHRHSTMVQNLKELRVSAAYHDAVFNEMVEMALPSLALMTLEMIDDSHERERRGHSNGDLIRSVWNGLSAESASCARTITDLTLSRPFSSENPNSCVVEPAFELSFPNLSSVSVMFCNAGLSSLMLPLLTRAALNLTRLELIKVSLSDLVLDRITTNVRLIRILSIVSPPADESHLTELGFEFIGRLSGSLRELALVGCDPLSDAALLAALRPQRNTSAFLELLDVSKCRLLTPETFSKLAFVVPRLATLRFDELNWCSAQSFGDLISHARSVGEHALRLTAFSCAFAKGVDDVVVGLLETRCPFLESLDVSYCSDVSMDLLCRRITSWPFLRQLSVRGLRCFSLQRDQALLQHSRLELLDCERCLGVPPQSLASLRAHCPRLTTLSISWISLSTDGVSTVTDPILRFEILVELLRPIHARCWKSISVSPVPPNLAPLFSALGEVVRF